MFRKKVSDVTRFIISRSCVVSMSSVVKKSKTYKAQSISTKSKLDYAAVVCEHTGSALIITITAKKAVLS